MIMMMMNFRGVYCRGATYGTRAAKIGNFSLDIFFWRRYSVPALHACCERMAVPCCVDFIFLGAGGNLRTTRAV